MSATTTDRLAELIARVVEDHEAIHRDPAAALMRALDAARPDRPVWAIGGASPGRQVPATTPPGGVSFTIGQTQAETPVLIFTVSVVTAQDPLSAKSGSAEREQRPRRGCSRGCGSLAAVASRWQG